MLVLELVARTTTRPGIRCAALCTCKWMASLANEIILPTSVRVEEETPVGTARAVHVDTFVGTKRHGPAYYSRADVRHQSYEITSYWDGTRGLVVGATLRGRSTYVVSIPLPGLSGCLKIKMANRPVRGGSGTACTCSDTICIQCVCKLVDPIRVHKLAVSICWHTSMIFKRGDEGFRQMNPHIFTQISKYILLPGATSIDWV
jgi:hypothetical protein